MNKQEETDLIFLLNQEYPLLDLDMKISAIYFMNKGYISKTKLSKMIGVSLKQLEEEILELTK